MSNQAMRSQLKALKAKAGHDKADALEMWFNINGRWYTSEALNIRLEAEMAGEDPEVADIGPGLSDEQFAALRLPHLSQINATIFC